MRKEPATMAALATTCRCLRGLLLPRLLEKKRKAILRYHMA